MVIAHWLSCGCLDNYLIRTQCIGPGVKGILGQQPIKNESEIGLSNIKYSSIKSICIALGYTSNCMQEASIIH